MVIVDSFIGYQKKLENDIFNFFYCGSWVLSLKNKVFRAKLSRSKLIQSLNADFDCSKLYKNLLWPLSEKSPYLIFCRVLEGENFVIFRILDLRIFNLNLLTYILQVESGLRLFESFSTLFLNSFWKQSIRA